METQKILNKEKEMQLEHSAGIVLIVGACCSMLLGLYCLFSEEGSSYITSSYSSGLITSGIATLLVGILLACHKKTAVSALLILGIVGTIFRFFREDLAYISQINPLYIVADLLTILSMILVVTMIAPSNPPVKTWFLPALCRSAALCCNVVISYITFFGSTWPALVWIVVVGEILFNFLMVVAFYFIGKKNVCLEDIVPPSITLSDGIQNTTKSESSNPEASDAEISAISDEVPIDDNSYDEHDANLATPTTNENPADAATTSSAIMSEKDTAITSDATSSDSATENETYHKKEANSEISSIPEQPSEPLVEDSLPEKHFFDTPDSII